MTAVAWRGLLAGLLLLVAISSFGQAPSSGMDRGFMPGEVAGIPNEVWKRRADSRAFAARHLIAIYDTNRDGKVSLDEFLAFHRKYLPQWDRDADGAISLNEYLLGCAALHKSQMQRTDQNTEQTAWIRHNSDAALSQLQFACMNSAQQFKTAAGRGIGNVPLLQAEEAVRKMFAQMDRNPDGVLSADELFMPAPNALALFADNANAPDATRIASEQLQGIFANTRNRRIAIYDLNGDGKVSLDEWMSYHRKHLQVWDTDGDGAISRDEYIQGCATDQMRQTSGLQSAQPVGAAQPASLGGMRDMMKQYAAQMKQLIQRMCENGVNQFVALDTEHTGKVTLAQAEVPYKAMFEAMDRNRDGFLTADEFQNADASMSDVMSRMPAKVQERALMEVFHQGLESLDRTTAGESSPSMNVARMNNAIGDLRESGLANAVLTLKRIVNDYQERYPEKPSHLRHLRVTLAKFMIDAGQLADAEEILVELASKSDQDHETDIETIEQLSAYAKLLCTQNRAEECLIFANRGLALDQRRVSMARAFNRDTLPSVGNFWFRPYLSEAYIQEERWADAESEIRSTRKDTLEQTSSLGMGPDVQAYYGQSQLVFVLLKQVGRERDTRIELNRLKEFVAHNPGGNANMVLETGLMESTLLFQERRFVESRALALGLPDSKLAGLLGDRAAALRSYIVAAATRNDGSKRMDLSASRGAVQLASNTTHEGYSVFTQLLNVRLPIEENLFALNKISDQGATNEAFALIQRGTTSATGDAIAAVAARFGKGSSDLAAVIRERQDLSNRREAARRQLFEKRIATTGNAEEPTSIANELPAMESRLAALDQDIAQRFPEYAELIRPAILSSSQAQALVRADQAIVGWFIGKEAGWAVVVRNTGTKVVRLKVDPLTLRRTVSAVRKSVDLGPAGFVVFPAQKAYELYEALIKPVAGELAGVKTLYVVPDSTLPSLPLSLLLTRKPSKSVINPDDTSAFARARWLIRDYAISVLPTVSSLRALQQLGKVADAPLSFFGIGDPLLADHPSLHNGKVTPNDSGAIRAISLRGVLADIGEIAKLPSLPETAGELTTIAAAFPQSGAELKLREQATEARVKTHDLSRYRVLAFATHGLVAGDFKGLAEPGLVLTPPDLATSADDGLLVASEVAGLKLNADWVVLSACNTGADDNRSASAGLGGLAKAFFYAGARTLMVSHWRVPSKATVELTTQTVAGSLSGGIGKAEAHRRSMLTMIASGSKEQSHPSAWAAFATVGLAD